MGTCKERESYPRDELVLHAVAREIREIDSREEWMPPLDVKNPQEVKEFVRKELGITEWLHVTQERIQQFADAIEDRQWIHVNPVRARSESPHGAAIAHGFLTLSLISHVMEEVAHIEGCVRLAVNCGLDRVRFPAPVRPDMSVRACIGALAVKELAESVEATGTNKTTLRSEGGGAAEGRKEGTKNSQKRS